MKTPVRGIRLSGSQAGCTLAEFLAAVFVVLTTERSVRLSTLVASHT